MDKPRTRQRERVDPNRNREHADWLARERRQWLARIAQRGGAPTGLVEDIVQAALLDVIRSFPGPDERRVVALYAAKCVTRQVMKAKRRFERKESHNRPLPTVARNDIVGTRQDAEALEDASAADPAEAAIAREQDAALAELLSELSEEQRAVVVLIAAGFSIAETARALSLSERQVRKRSETGRAKLARRRRERGI